MKAATPNCREPTDWSMSNMDVGGGRLCTELWKRASKETLWD